MHCRPSPWLRCGHMQFRDDKTRIFMGQPYCYPPRMTWYYLETCNKRLIIWGYCCEKGRAFQISNTSRTSNVHSWWIGGVIIEFVPLHWDFSLPFIVAYKSCGGHCFNEGVCPPCNCPSSPLNSDINEVTVAGGCISRTLVRVIFNFYCPQNLTTLVTFFLDRSHSHILAL